MKPTATALLNRLLARGKFRHVQMLLAIAELGSVQRAAEAIGLTQSSVTQSLAALEALLDAKLFERHARGVRPTPACTDLLPVARLLMKQLAEGADTVVAARAQGQGLIRMIGSAAAMQGLLVDAIPAFIDAHPGIQIHLGEAEGEDQLLAVARGEVDLVVCREPATIPRGWEFHAIRQDRFAILCRPRHPLAGVRSASLAQLAAHTWLRVPAGYAARARFDELAAGFPQPPRLYPVLSLSLPMMWWSVRNRDLLILLSLQMARPQLDAGELVEIPFKERVAMRPLGILQPAAGVREAAAQFSRFLRGFSRPPDVPGRRRAARG